MSGHATLTNKRCPKCGSDATVHKDRAMHGVNHAAGHHAAHHLHGIATGHPGGLVVVAGLWMASKLMHATSKPWTCEMCHHQFS